MILCFKSFMYIDNLSRFEDYKSYVNIIIYYFSEGEKRRYLN